MSEKLSEWAERNIPSMLLSVTKPILMEKILVLEAKCNAIKEQLGRLMKFTRQVENFDYIWTNHSDIPQFYTMITKGHYATCIDTKMRAKSAEGRLVEMRDNFKKACENDHQCGIALLNDHDCERCEWYPVWRILAGGVEEKK